MNKVFRWGCWAFFLLVTPVQDFARAADSKQLVHAKYIIVNGKAITLEDVRRATEYSLSRYLKKRNTQVIDSRDLELLQEQYQELARREMIKAYLYDDACRRRGITIKPEQIDSRLRRMGVDPTTAPETAKYFAKAELQFDSILASKGQLNPPLSPKKIRAFYKKQKDTLFRTHRMVIVRQIFFGTGPIESRSKKVQRAKAEAIRNAALRLPLKKRRAFFIEKAILGDGPESQHQGLIRVSRDPKGWFSQKSTTFLISKTQTLYPHPVIQRIRGLVAPGDIAPVTESRSGFHLLYLDSAKGGKQMSFEKAQPIIRQFLTQNKRSAELRRWLRNTLRRSSVTWHDGTPYPQDDILPPAGSAAMSATPQRR